MQDRAHNNRLHRIFCSAGVAQNPSEPGHYAQKETEKKMPNYWVVGATWGGHDDQSEKFIRRGYWFLGWEDKDQPVRQSYEIKSSRVTE